MLKGFNIFPAKIAPICLITCLFACSESEPQLSEIPRIDLSQVEVLDDQTGKDSIVNITIAFWDGDGDIGLGPEDTMEPFGYFDEYYQNLPVRIFHYVNGTKQELLNPSTNKPFRLPAERIPRITPEGKNKSIAGKITVHLPTNPLNTRPDSVIYELMLIDRALNKSNIVETPIQRLEH